MAQFHLVSSYFGDIDRYGGGLRVFGTTWAEHQMMAEAPVPDTGSAAEDFRLTLRGMMGFYTSPLGAIYAQLVGESQFYPTERERIRTHQVNVRRAAVTKIWDRGVARGELDPNVDPAVALDLIFGPAMYRMATGHGALTPYDADA